MDWFLYDGMIGTSVIKELINCPVEKEFPGESPLISLLQK